ncbi:MAG: 2-hydroxyhepta-2,4-diene-1,7-dioate isomerase [Bacteroides sp. SM23_62_1]|nr:MAG: 2-hydroxyhepta-2,4-diene-1,7-dioate isomerase [Bacteroides sp. SM23_62_1]
MKIICIGRNYVEHARELNNPLPQNPIFFMKHEACIVRNNKPFFYPDFSQNIHHEVEIVVKIGRLGKAIAKKYADRYYDEIGIGIDFTARDLQDDARKKGLPWEVAKAFDNSAPISRFYNKKDFPDIQNISFHLDINGKTVQHSNTANMIFPVDELISYVSRFITLKTGDLIFTGTPSGVGPVAIGDHLEAFIEDKKMMDFWVR